MNVVASTVDSDRIARSGIPSGKAGPMAAGLASAVPASSLPAAYVPGGAYGERNTPRWMVLAGIVLFHAVLFAIAVTVRYEADRRERMDRLTVISVSNPSPPPAPADPVPENPAVPPISAPPPRIVLPVSSPVQAAPVPLPDPQPLSVAVAAPEAPAAPAAAPAPPAPITPPDFTAGQLNNPGPSYPYLSRKAKEEGVVLLRVLVSAEGGAKELRVDTSSGYERLDKAALKTVKKWRFLPARRGGTAVEAWVIVPVTFSLS